MAMQESNIDDCFEDAFFANLMLKYAEDEGKRLIEENRRLKNDDGFSLPEGFEFRSHKVISKAFEDRNKKIDNTQISSKRVRFNHCAHH